jgi:hypothetical protein
MERRQKERKEKTKKRENEASRGVLAACEEKEEKRKERKRKKHPCCARGTSMGMSVICHGCFVACCCPTLKLCYLSSIIRGRTGEENQFNNSPPRDRFIL